MLNKRVGFLLDEHERLFLRTFATSFVYLKRFNPIGGLKH